MQNQNQFSQTPEKGDLAFRMRQDTVSAVIDDTEATTLVAGQAVKLVATSKGLFRVVAAGDEDIIFGFIARDFKDIDYVKGDRVTVTMPKGFAVVYMEANAAIPAYSDVAIVPVGVKVAVAAGAKTIVGKALDNAVAANELIRVQVTV